MELVSPWEASAHDLREVGRPQGWNAECGLRGCVRGDYPFCYVGHRAGYPCGAARWGLGLRLRLGYRRVALMQGGLAMVSGRRLPFSRSGSRESWPSVVQSEGSRRRLLGVWRRAVIGVEGCPRAEVGPVWQRAQWCGVGGASLGVSDVFVGAHVLWSHFCVGARRLGGFGCASPLRTV